MEPVEEEPTMAKEDVSVKGKMSEDKSVPTISAPQGAAIESRELSETPEASQESREAFDPASLLCGCV